MTGTGQHGHQVGDHRGGEGDVFGVLAQGFFGQVHQVVHPAGQLHAGDGADDGRDDHDHVPGDVGDQLIARDLHPEAPGQHQYPQTTGKADADAAYPGPQIDSGEHDEQLDSNHSEHSIFQFFGFLFGKKPIPDGAGDKDLSGTDSMGRDDPGPSSLIQ